MNLIEEKLKKFEKVYTDAVESIKRYQADEDVGDLVNWLLATDINPFSFLDNGNLMSSAEGFDHLCHLLHHALVDDGDVTFLSVDGAPKIVFVCRWDLKEYKRKKYKLVDVDGKPKLDHDMIDSDIVIFESYDDWIASIEKYTTEHLKKCYLSDKQQHGEDFATNHYSKNKRFNPDWILMTEKEDT